LGYKNLQLRRDSPANWTSNNPVLLSGEFGVEIGTGKFKIGNGTTVWSGLAYAVASISTTIEEQRIWQIRLAKLRPSLIREAHANFTPVGYNVHPVIGSGWRFGVNDEYIDGAGYAYGRVIVDGTQVDIDTNNAGWLLYVKSTDVMNFNDSVQADPVASYYKRIDYLNSLSCLQVSDNINKNWGIKIVTPGVHGSLLLSYTYNNVRVFDILDSTKSYRCYRGSISARGQLSTGFNRTEAEFLVPFDAPLVFKVKVCRNPKGGGTYSVKYIDVPSWW